MFRSAQTLDDAVDEVSRWADSLPGEFAVEVTDFDDATVIEVTGTLISSGLAIGAWVLSDTFDEHPSVVLGGHGGGLTTERPKAVCQQREGCE